MGLPLFIAPVESDVPAKSAAKSPASPAATRSPIRRSDRRRQINEIREHRLRMLAALQSDDDISPHLAAARANNPRPAENPPAPERPLPPRESPPTSRYDDLLRQLERERERDREQERRDPIRSHPTYEMNQAYLEDIGGTPWGLVSSLDLPTPTTNPSRPTRSPRSRGSSLFPHDQAYRLDPSRFDPTGYLSWSVSRRSWAREQDRHRQEVSRSLLDRPRRRASVDFHRRAHRVRYVDGLGDRDRSLSPEGDGVWDTLQSTLTPDPQPPSVGSSFASTSASAVASQSTNASSSNTSITNPEDTTATEPPCDPVNENSDTDGEEEEDEDEEEEDQRAGASRRPTPPGRRSYADVLAEYGDAPEIRSGQSPEDSENTEGDRLEWLSGMHRIVRGLAARQDIPDEWWAQAGLSRSMSWGEPN
ncbi:hypothetical protein F4775DRAFT_569181 [Biscogniauxia sp. FL1348]|nr:hypothetical protein F4775DRAFT_569181 [Biscogniauxia sp. FL1348]